MAEKIGVFFGSASGSTEEVAEMISEAFGDAAAEPLNIDDVMDELGDHFAKYEALICGTPTYNTDADQYRSATSWDSVYYEELSQVKLDGKPVACFGLGDQEGYGDNFADGVGEMHDVFKACGATMYGYTDATDGSYEHGDSKAQVGDQFVALVCDNANQADLSEERVTKWVAQLKAEGFLAAGVEAGEAEAAEEEQEVATDVEKVNDAVASALATETTEEYEGYEPYHSPLIGQTLWVSRSDHTKSFYTFEKKGKK
jgi:flavodoxin I